MSAFAVAKIDDLDAGTSFIIQKLKKELASRGAKGIVGLGRKFKSEFGELLKVWGVGREGREGMEMD